MFLDYILLGDSAHKAKKWDDAISYYTMAITLDANNANSYMKRAESYLECKSYNKAKEDCNSAIGLDNKCAKAYSLRGKAHQLLGCGKEANEDLKRAQELDKSKQMKKRAHPQQNVVYAANRSSTFTIAGPILIQNMNIIFYNRPRYM
ncbi:hypothetical protein ACHQM5_005615 [Ranunculus cassubicifolius]